MSTFAERLIGAASLNVHVYEEVEADSRATSQAMVTVVLASIAQGIGIAGLTGAEGYGVLQGIVGALMSWVIWGCLVYIIGTKILPESQTSSNLGELLRTTGFSASPGLLRILGVVPFFGTAILLAVNIWMLVAMIIAVRQALDYQSTGRAVGVCLISWFVAGLIVVMLTGGGAA